MIWTIKASEIAGAYICGRQLATYDSAGTHFALTDWLGTKRVELNVTGVSTVAVGEQCQSLPYGDGLSCTGTDVNQLHFTGKQHDTESGNDYFLARYYASGMAARFLTPDWSKNPQGVPYANYADPQSLDLYSYMRDNPLSGVDADGHLGLGAAPPCKVMHGTTCANAQDAMNFKKEDAKHLAGQRKLNGGSPITLTLNLGGVKVKVSYRFGAIFSNYAGGMVITADPQNCDNCTWSQVVTRTGIGAQGPTKDGEGVGPLYGAEIPFHLNEFYDTPANASGPATFSGTAIVGTANIGGKSFTAKGAMTYEYGISGKGAVRMITRPRVSTPAEINRAIQVLRSNSPDWQIH